MTTNELLKMKREGGYAPNEGYGASKKGYTPKGSPPPKLPTGPKGGTGVKPVAAPQNPKGTGGSEECK